MADSMETTSQAGYRAYLLRLWHTPEAPGGWHASLEDPHTGLRRAFASLSEMAAFLAQAPPGSGSADGGQPSRAAH